VEVRMGRTCQSDSSHLAGGVAGLRESAIRPGSLGYARWRLSRT
jgi:hypothetical protein